MKSTMYLFVASMLCIAAACYATDPPPPSTNSGDVIFYTEENQSAVEPIVVTCSLNGIVFDNEAIWNDQISDLHSQYDTYKFFDSENHNNALLGSTHELTTSRTLVAWESVYDGDYAASSTYCTGMVGWGVYTFTVGYGDAISPIVFTLNTVDGRWMYQNGADHKTNKFIFKVTREVTGGISLEVYNWDWEDFVQVQSSSTITFQSNNVWGERFRDGLNPSSVMPFTLSLVDDYPLGCDEAVIDVHLVCDASLKIACGKKISIVDFFDNYTQAYESTIVRFASGKGIVVDFNNLPYLTTTLFIQGHDTDNLKTVVFASASYDGSDDPEYTLWYGISAQRGQYEYSSSDISLKHCAILNAGYGMEVLRWRPDAQYHNLEIDNCIIRHCGEAGVWTQNSNVNLHNTEIDHSKRGVWHEGYTFYDNHPNRVENCIIQNIDDWGILILWHARGIDASMGRPTTLTIQGNFMQYCLHEGISVINSLAIVRGNIIHAMGGSKSNETPPKGYSGLWADQSDLCFHGNQVDLCTAYGLQADYNSLVRGNYLNYNEGDGGYGGIDNANELLQGRNCFEENDFNVGTSNNTSGTPDSWKFTKIVLGKQSSPNDPLGINFLGHYNTFAYPTQTDNDTHEKWQMTAEQSSGIWAYRNFWESDPPIDPTKLVPILITPPAKIYREFVLPDVEDVCERNTSPPLNRNVFSSVQTYSDNTEMVLTRTLLGLTDEAAMMAYNTINNSMDSTEADILMLALRSAYIYDYDVVARDTLKKYAFYPHDPGATVEYLTQTALVHLITAEILVDNWEGAIVAIDTVLARDVPPIVKAEYLAQKVAYYFRTTSDSSYLSTLDNLLTLYPDDNAILLEKYLITLDTTFLMRMGKAVSPPRQTNAAPRPDVVSFPSPAKQHQTVLAAKAMDVRTVTLYDYLGRTVDASLYTYSLADDGIHMTYNLPEGLYFMTIRYDETILHTRVVVDR